MKKRFSFELIKQPVGAGIALYTIIFLAFNRDVIFEEASLFYKINFIFIVLLNFVNMYLKYDFTTSSKTKLRKYIFMSLYTIFLLAVFIFFMISFNGSLYTIQALPEFKTIYLLLGAAAMLLSVVLYFVSDELSIKEE